MGDGGIQWDAPNQQVVRDDASAPWAEGTGGETGEPVTAAAEEATLETMTKAQLLDHAQALGLDVDDSMTKADIKAEIEAN
jgi:4-aminobutyrate aminotransferase-like enzyme